jgi:xylulokinase
MYLLGLDIGSSSIKAALVEAQTGKVVAASTSPDKELEMLALQTGWAEQHPDLWWQHIKNAIVILKNKNAKAVENIAAIGISYQMHGLVIVDKDLQPLRPAIIWCDSRAVNIGDTAFEQLGQENCLKELLNSPGNFTASKLKWVKENEPEVFAKIYKMMLPGDYVAMKLTGELCTTATGLSEGILWNFLTESPSKMLMNYYGIADEMLPKVVPTFSQQGKVTTKIAEELGIPANVPITYRAGDQPNNAFSLNVLHPGEVAANAGTSGVIYGINDQPNYDRASRVNTFVHVNHHEKQKRYGVLACVNGTGIMNSWLRNQFQLGEYPTMNEIATKAPIGTDGLVILPFGNGAERTLENKDIQARIIGINFNRHSIAHVLRAAQEGIVFALNYGFDIMKEMGISIQTVRAGKANMFLSPLFQNAFATVSNSVVELYDTDGAQGAARAAGIGAGIYATEKEAFQHLNCVQRIEPNLSQQADYQDAYSHWKNVLKNNLT